MTDDFAGKKEELEDEPKGAEEIDEDELGDADAIAADMQAANEEGRDYGIDEEDDD